MLPTRVRTIVGDKMYICCTVKYFKARENDLLKMEKSLLIGFLVRRLRELM
jgi:hypothetical protein